ARRFVGRQARNVIDQPRLAKTRRDQETKRPIVYGLDAAQRFGMARLEIVHREPRPFDRKPSLAHNARDRLARRDPCCALPEGTVERRRDGALGWRQIDVARRQGKAVLLAHRRHADDIDLEIKTRPPTTPRLYPPIA